MQFGFKKCDGLVRRMRILALIVVALFATSAHSASKTVLELGDSLSAEYVLARGSGWVALLQNKLRTEKSDAVIVNASISGDTTSGGKARLQALLDQYHPTVLVIELGANDGLRGLPLASTENNLRAMIVAAQKSKAKVLLVGMKLPPNYGRDYAERFFALYGKLAKETRSSLAPFLLDGVADQPQLFQTDRLHPNADAHPIILQNVWPHLQALLKK